MPAEYTYHVNPDIGDDKSFADLLAYWNRKRGDRLMPARADIDPVDLKSHLGSLLLIEVLPGLADFRYRLIGTNITAAYGRDSTGKTVSELYQAADPDTYRWLMVFYRLVAEERAPVRGGIPLRAVGKHFMSFDTLYLPLSHDGTTVDMILAESHFAAAG
jgi:hypothetical protein